MHIEKVRQTYMESYFLEAAKEKGLPIHDTNGPQGEGKNNVLLLGFINAMIQ